MDFNVLMIDDDLTICKQVQELLNDEVIKEHKLKLECTDNFDNGLSILKEKTFDLIILDLYKGKPEEGNKDRSGEVVLEEVKKICFIPVVFFSGLIKPIEHLQSDIVRVVRKGDGTAELRKTIESILESPLPFIKKKMDIFVHESMRSYFWDFVHKNWNSLKGIKDGISLGYLLVRRLANSLSKGQIIKLLGDPKINPDKSVARGLKLPRKARFRIPRFDVWA